MKQRPPFKNLPKVQAKRFKKLRLERERERARRTKVQPAKKRSLRRRRLTCIIHVRNAAATSLQRAGAPLATSTYCFKSASLSWGSACPSRDATAQLHDEPS